MRPLRFALLLLLALAAAACDSITPERHAPPEDLAPQALTFTPLALGQSLFSRAQAPSPSGIAPALGQSTLSGEAAYAQLQSAQTGCYISTPNVGAPVGARYRYDAFLIGFPSEIVRAAQGRKQIVAVGIGSTSLYAGEAERSRPALVRVARCVVPDAPGAVEVLRARLRAFRPVEDGAAAAWEGEAMAIPDTTLGRLTGEAQRASASAALPRLSVAGTQSCASWVEFVDRQYATVEDGEYTVVNVRTWYLVTVCGGEGATYEWLDEETSGGGTGGTGEVCHREAMPWDAIDAFGCPIDDCSLSPAVYGQSEGTSRPLRAGDPLRFRAPLASISYQSVSECPDVPWPDVTNQQVLDWMRDKCQITDRTAANDLFADNVAAAFGVARDPRAVSGGLDGYSRFVYNNGSVHTNHTTMILEVKNTADYAFEIYTSPRLRDTSEEAIYHMGELVKERDRIFAEFGHGWWIWTPTYIVVTTGSNERLDPNDRVLNYARQNNINLVVYRLQSEWLVDWQLNATRLHTVVGSYGSTYASLSKDRLPPWLRWLDPASAVTPDADVRMSCAPRVVIAPSGHTR